MFLNAANSEVQCQCYEQEGTGVSSDQRNAQTLAVHLLQLLMTQTVTARTVLLKQSIGCSHCVPTEEALLLMLIRALPFAALLK